MHLGAFKLHLTLLWLFSNQPCSPLSDGIIGHLSKIKNIKKNTFRLSFVEGDSVNNLAYRSFYTQSHTKSEFKETKNFPWQFHGYHFPSRIIRNNVLWGRLRDSVRGLGMDSAQLYIHAGWTLKLCVGMQTKPVRFLFTVKLGYSELYRIDRHHLFVITVNCYTHEDLRIKATIWDQKNNKFFC